MYELDPFGFEGYFSVLVGQNVPWRNPWRPSEVALAKWATVGDGWRRMAATALTVNEANDLLLGRAPMRRPQAQGRALQTVG